MLTALSIANIVLIERLDLDFAAGLGVLTGETGAGKSILLDALGLAPHERMAGFVHIGRPRKPPEERDRPKLADIVSRYPATR